MSSTQWKKAPSTFLRLGAEFSFVVWITFSILTAFIAFHHEIWRDEMRALSICKAAHSIAELFSLLRNEGHPPLWYFTLFGLYKIFHANWVLKFAAWFYSSAAAFVFLRYSNFSKVEKIIFLLGAFPLIEYTVNCRPYGLGMLLIFLICTQFKNRFEKPWRFFGLIVLLGLVHAHLTILSLLIAFVSGAEMYFRRRDWKVLIPTSLPFLVGAMSFFVWRPDYASLINPFAQLNASAVLNSLVQFVSDPGKSFLELFGPNPIICNLTLLGFALYFAFYPPLLILFLAYAVCLHLFSTLVYPIYIWHQGLLYILAVALVWVARNIEKKDWPLRDRLFKPFFLIVLIYHTCVGLSWAWSEIKYPYSASEQVGEFISSSSKWKNAIISGEFDYYLDALPYYLDNPIFFSRLNRYDKWSRFTTEAKAQLSLGQLLDDGENQQKLTAKPVLFIMCTKIDFSSGEAKTFDYGFDSTFSWSVEDLKRFESSTKLVGEFLAPTNDESFRVYELIPK
jgi:hypothetical protein